MTNGTLEPVREFFQLGSFTLPHSDDIPSKLLQSRFRPLIARDIFRKFTLPELNTALWIIGVLAAGVPVPETTVHEDGRSMFRQYQIRGSWQVPLVQAEAVSQAMEKFADNYLRLGVFALDAPHIPAAALRSEAVSHRKRGFVTPNRLSS